jgi:hypothetical protein
MTAPRYVLYLTNGLAHAFDAEQRRSVQLANQEAARRIFLHDQLTVLMGAAGRLLHAAGVNSGAPQALASGAWDTFEAHADRIAAAWADLKSAVERVKEQNP